MQREAYFDNAKLLFIFLVVFGHIIQPLKTSIPLADILYQWIYLFHMPAFVLVSGFFAKGSGEKSYIMKLVKRILLPYIIFHIFYTVYFYGIGKNGWDTSIVDPHWGLWFLISLFCWHMLLVLFKRFPAKWGILFAFVLGIGVGYVPFINETFSLSRTFVFFPFFLMGFWFSKEKLFRMQTVKRKWISAGVLVTIFAISYVTPTIQAQWLFGSHPYVELEAPVYGGILRAALYTVAILMTFSALTLVPRTRLSFTHLGEQTMYVYLLHGLFIQYIRQANLLQLEQNLDIIGLIVIAAAIVWLLSSKWVGSLTQWLVETDYSLGKRSWRTSASKRYKEEKLS